MIKLPTPSVSADLRLVRNPAAIEEFRKALRWDDSRVVRAVDAYERLLLTFTKDYRRDLARVANDPRVRKAFTEGVENLIARAAKQFRSLNETEQYVVKLWVHGCTVGGSVEPSFLDIDGFLGIMSRITVPKTVAVKGRPPALDYRNLAERIVAFWRDEGVAVTRSEKRAGIIHLTSLLAACIDMTIEHFASADLARRPLDALRADRFKATLVRHVHEAVRRSRASNRLRKK